MARGKCNIEKKEGQDSFLKTWERKGIVERNR